MILFFAIFTIGISSVFGQRNVNFNASAGVYIQTYYQQFDNPVLRPNLKTFYDLFDSTLSLNGEVISGSNAIFDKLNPLPKFNGRTFLNIDNQPKIDGGSISLLFSRATLDNGTIVLLSEMIMLTPKGVGFYVQNQHIRLITNLNFLPPPAAVATRFIFSSLSNTVSPAVVAPAATPVGVPAAVSVVAPTAVPVVAAPAATSTAGLKFAG